MTYKLLPENRGEELLTLYLAGFPAKTLAQQEKERDWTESDQACGKKWRVSLAKYNQDTHSWKTAQCSLLEDSISFLQTLPKWGLMQNGALYPLPTLARTISEKEFGLGPNKNFMWPTPVVRDHKDTGTQEALLRAFNSRHSPGIALIVGAETGGRLNPVFTEWIMGWPLEWTGLKRLEMDKFQEWQQQHGNY
jgi:hypothetical protein